MSDKPYHRPYKAGRLESGEVFYVTEQEYTKDPAGFQGYANMFRVYTGKPDSILEVPLQSASRMRDGGSTYIEGDVNLAFAIRGNASLNGQPAVQSIRFPRLK